MARKGSKTLGKVYLVGAGPGDPGLLTLRAQTVLKNCEIVFYDHLVHPQILEHCPQAVQKYVGKVGYGERVQQEQIQEQLFQAAKNFSRVVRLKGGDPFIFGRGGEEAEFLESQGVPFEVIPGVSSATGVPVYGGIPLTHRQWGSSVTFFTGHEGGEKGGTINWKHLAGSETLVLLMGVHRLQQNIQSLMDAGKSSETPAALIEWGSYPRQRTLMGKLGDLAGMAKDSHLEAPALAVIGEVVRLRERLQWFEKRPLFGRRILLTRERRQGAAMRERLSELGAEVMEMPTLELRGFSENPDLDSILDRLEEFSLALFTSVNGVDFFFESLRRKNCDIRKLHRARLIAVGPATRARLENLGLRVAGMPEVFTSRAMGLELKDGEIRGAHILFPRAAEGREEIIHDLESRGAIVKVLKVYEALCPSYSTSQLREIFGERPPHLLTFASASTVRNFCKILKDSIYQTAALKIPGIVIGPVTKEAAEAKGIKVVGMPKSFTFPAMVEEILKYFGMGGGFLPRQ